MGLMNSCIRCVSRNIYSVYRPGCGYIAVRTVKPLKVGVFNEPRF